MVSWSFESLGFDKNLPHLWELLPDCRFETIDRRQYFVAGSASHEFDHHIHENLIRSKMHG